MKQKKKNNNNNKERNINNNICEHMLISKLKVTNSLKADFTEFAWAVSWLPSFYF